ncbi:unnamed protein product, partial [Urochloa humidicola]
NQNRRLVAAAAELLPPPSPRRAPSAAAPSAADPPPPTGGGHAPSSSSPEASPSLLLMPAAAPFCSFLAGGHGGEAAHLRAQGKPLLIRPRSDHGHSKAAPWILSRPSKRLRQIVEDEDCTLLRYLIAEDEPNYESMEHNWMRYGSI